MNNATHTGSDDIFGGAILANETMACTLLRLATRKRVEGDMESAVKYQQMAEDMLGDAGADLAAEEQLAARLAAIRAM